MALVALLRRAIVNEPVLSEPEAHDAYRKHAKQCLRCKPRAGRLCPTGSAKYAAWIKAQAEQ